MGESVFMFGPQCLNKARLLQREVSRKLYVQLPELSQLLDRTLARAPKDEYGPPPGHLWHCLVVSCLRPAPASQSRLCE